MPDSGAARQVARCLWMGAGVFALLLGFCVMSSRDANAVANLRNPATVAPPPVSLPELPAPAVRADHSEGTTASGPVRVERAHMPFYVATKGQTTLYILGTLHVGYASDYPANEPFRKPILAALDASPILALEISPDDMLVSQDDITKYGVCRRSCLPQMLPDTLYKKLESRMRGNLDGLEQIRKTRPWLASMLVETYDTMNAGFQAEYGSEAQLQNVYLRAHGRIVGLESLNEQMATFTRLTLAQQREMLAQDLVQTPAENIADVKELYRLWRIGDADALKAWDDAKSEKLARSSPVAAQLDNRVVYDRNVRFTARMLALAAPNKPVFVAIGALHLGGSRGVLALLRKRGFMVEPA
jgi:uncharacterized protein YbaP (TraB family)